jgi:Ca2+-binding EF-hand superfamily protein
MFLQYDTSDQGFIEKRELRQRIDEERADDLPRGLVRAITSLNEAELDGQIDFDDFVFMSQSPTRKSSVRDWCVRYCESVVAPRNDLE